MEYKVLAFSEESERRALLSAYLKNCDWKAGNLLAQLIEKNAVPSADDEIYFLMDKENVVSFLTLARQDCISDETLEPWIGFVYTDKKYRGHRSSEKLIRHALNAARDRGYDKVYLATGHIGLYEKYGFEYMESRADINGEDSRIYFFDLSRL